MVTLTATPASGSTFAGWSGACSGTSPTCTVTMDAAKSVTATFTNNTPPPPDPGPEPQTQIIDNDNPLINYGKGWNRETNPNAASGSLMIGHNAGGGAGIAMSFTFTGSSIQWKAKTHPQGGSARVYIDGVYIGIVNLSSSGTSFGTTVFNWSGSSGQHTIKIEPMPSLPGFTVNIDRFIVQ